MDENNTPVFGDQNTAFEAQRQALARRRKLAEQLIQQGMQGNTGSGYQGGKVFIVGNPLGNIASSVAGNIFANQADKEQSTLEASQRQHEQTLMDAIANAPDPQQRQQAMLRAAQQAPSLRDAIKMQMDMDKQEADRIERGEQQAADRVEKEANANAQREFLAAQGDLNRQNRLDLRQMPATVVHVGSGKSQSSTPGAVSDGKPLTAAQEKAALELGSNRSNLQMLTDTFKDEYAGDLRSTIQRKFGEVAGGAAPQATQDMTRWWANQAMFDELPQRHELFGATLTAGEKAAWASAAISPNMSPAQIRERLAIRSKIYDDAEARMRGSAVAGGRSGKQFDAAVGKKPGQSQPVAIKSQAEWQQLPAGTPYTLPDGRKGVR